MRLCPSRFALSKFRASAIEARMAEKSQLYARSVGICCFRKQAEEARRRGHAGLWKIEFAAARTYLVPPAP
jgi:hypothetical protein